MTEKLDSNQNYILVRRAIVNFFGSGMYSKLGFESGHFEPAMRFVKNLYYESEKRKVDVQR